MLKSLRIHQEFTKLLIGRELIGDSLHESCIRFYSVEGAIKLYREYRKVLNPVEKDHFTIFSNGYMVCSVAESSRQQQKKCTFESINEKQNHIEELDSEFEKI